MDKHRKKKAFLDKYLFFGLKNLNTGFDAKGIKYFSQKDFAIVLSRVETLRLGVYGIEPWLDDAFFGVAVYESFDTSPSDASWYWSAFWEFVMLGLDLQYSASYHVPDQLLLEG